MSKEHLELHLTLELDNAGKILLNIFTKHCLFSFIMQNYILVMNWKAEVINKLDHSVILAKIYFNV